MKKKSNLSLSFVPARQKKYPAGDAVMAAVLFAGILGTFCTTSSLAVYPVSYTHLTLPTILRV